MAKRRASKSSSRRKNAGERYVIEFEDPSERWSAAANSTSELRGTLESVTGDARIAQALLDKLEIAGDVEYTSDMVADGPQTFGIGPDELEDVLADLPDVSRLVVYVDAREQNPSVRDLKRSLMQI